MFEEVSHLGTDVLLDWYEEDDEASMCQIIDYLNEFTYNSDNFQKMLKWVDINIDFEVPEYQQDRLLTRVDWTNEMIGLGLVRDGKIDADEGAIIEDNWNSFCNTYNIINKPELFARWRNRDCKTRKASKPEENLRKQVSIYLAKGLKRTLFQVYNYFVKKYSYKKFFTYSAEEERLINICFSHCTNSNIVVLLSNFLEREPRGLYKRFASFKSDQKNNIHLDITNSKIDNTKVIWSIELVNHLVKSLMKVNRIEDIQKLKNNSIGRLTWELVSYEMNIPLEKLQVVWYKKLHVQLFVEEDIYLSRLRKNILNSIWKAKHLMWREISWKKLLKYFPSGYTSLFIHYNICKIMKIHCPKYLSLPLSEVLLQMKSKKDLWSKSRKELKKIVLDHETGSFVLKRKGEKRINCSS